MHPIQKEWLIAEAPACWQQQHTLSLQMQQVLRAPNIGSLLRNVFAFDRPENTMLSLCPWLVSVYERSQAAATVYAPCADTQVKQQVVQAINTELTAQRRTMLGWEKAVSGLCNGVVNATFMSGFGVKHMHPVGVRLVHALLAALL